MMNSCFDMQIKECCIAKVSHSQMPFLLCYRSNSSDQSHITHWAMSSSLVTRLSVTWVMHCLCSDCGAQMDKEPTDFQLKLTEMEQWVMNAWKKWPQISKGLYMPRLLQELLLLVLHKWQRCITSLCSIRSPFFFIRMAMENNGNWKGWQQN